MQQAGKKLNIPQQVDGEAWLHIQELFQKVDLYLLLPLPHLQHTGFDF